MTSSTITFVAQTIGYWGSYQYFLLEKQYVRPVAALEFHRLCKWPWGYSTEGIARSSIVHLHEKEDRLTHSVYKYGSCEIDFEVEFARIRCFSETVLFDMLSDRAVELY